MTSLYRFRLGAAVTIYRWVDEKRRGVGPFFRESGAAWRWRRKLDPGRDAEN